MWRFVQHAFKLANKFTGTVLGTRKNQDFANCPLYLYLGILRAMQKKISSKMPMPSFMPSKMSIADFYAEVF